VASIDERGGKIRVRWIRLDKTETSRTCPDKKTAKALQREIESTLASGKEWEPEGSRGAPQLREMTEAYVVAINRRVRPETARRYATALDLFLRFVHGVKRPRSCTSAVLSRALLEDYHAWLQLPETGLHGHERSPDTVRKLVEVVQLFWEWAENSERWPGHVPHPRRIELAKSLPQQVVSPSFEEMALCVLACEGWQRKVTMFLFEH
jgi:hypothetical protein